MLEMHIVPVDGSRRSARLMAQLSEQLVAGLRSAGAVSAAIGVAPKQTADFVTIDVPAEQRGFRDVWPG